MVVASPPLPWQTERLGMYSKYDDPNYRPAPGERERDRLRTLYAKYYRLEGELRAVRDEIRELESLPYVLDTPLPNC